LKTIRQVERIAREHTQNALNVLIGIMNSREVEPRSRVAAAKAVLDRGWGAPMHRHELNGGDGPKLLKVVREIVHLEREVQPPIEIVHINKPPEDNRRVSDLIGIDYKDVTNGNDR